MVKFWIKNCMVCSNLGDLELDELSDRELMLLSIAKWEFIAKAVEADEGLVAPLNCGGVNTCALCHRFYLKSDIGCHIGCQNCPIARSAGVPECELTPYVDYRMWGAEPQIIQNEIAFLREVLNGL